MTLDKSLVEKFRLVTTKAAYAASKFRGLNDKIGADKAAVDVMRTELNKIDMQGRVVIGEGELDEAPMLYIGEKLGSGKGQEIDIAVDPVEGTNFVAKNLPGGIAVLAISEKNNLLNAPETYMHKLAIGKNIEKGVVDLDFNLETNLKNLADAKFKKLSELTVCLLDRPRHKEIIDTLDEFKVNKKLISDGDVSGALYVTDDKFGVDMFIGIGGGPEGVLAASALDASNCFFQGRFIFDNEKDIKRARQMNIKDINKKYNLNEIVAGDSIFSATGITDGDLVMGINEKNNSFKSETLVSHKSSGRYEIIKSTDEIL
ncbi:class II fructose-bisphosphatase [Candidatus Pelagibacter sp.]|nr:class II fructose-bisphosphatase [Candidatus Pelagibacter sp.]